MVVGVDGAEGAEGARWGRGEAVRPGSAAALLARMLFDTGPLTQFDTGLLVMTLFGTGPTTPTLFDTRSLTLMLFDTTLPAGGRWRRKSRVKSSLSGS